MTYPAALPHDPPVEIAPDLYVVHGCVSPGPGVRFTRNMVIVRDAGKLTLINPVRMDEPGLNALQALGEIAHVLRLGPMHGMDDPFYVERYDAKFWAFEGGTTYTTPNIDHALNEGAALPFNNAQLFAFQHMKETEGAILLERSSNILITCDAIQSYATAPHMPHTNWLSRLMMPFIGFPKKTLIGPIWIKLLVTDKRGIEEEFQRLLTLEFDQLIAAHGTFLPQDAHGEVKRAVQTIFG
ncbi:MAG: hypothetical protein AB8C02_01135 [Halioglobus sp.]